MRHDIIDNLAFRLGKADDVEPLLTEHGEDHFTEGGFAAFSTFDLERAVREMKRLLAQGDTPFLIGEIAGEFVGWISWTTRNKLTVADRRLVEHLRPAGFIGMARWSKACLARSRSRRAAGGCAFLRHRRADLGRGHPSATCFASGSRHNGRAFSVAA
jgi:hypothetical protein